MVRGMFGLGGVRLRYLRAWLMIWSARLRPGSSRLDALQVSVLAAAQLLGCFEGCPRVFGEIAEEGERA